MKLFDLSGKVAVVTGGNGGIGLGMAQGMASCGAAIVIAGRDEAKTMTASGGAPSKLVWIFSPMSLPHSVLSGRTECTVVYWVMIWHWK